MKKIQIDYKNDIYEVNVTYINAFPYGYYKIEWDNAELLKIIASPVYISSNKEGGLSIPYCTNLAELTLLFSITSGIFTNLIFKNIL